jgi:hypothetical protein
MRRVWQAVLLLGLGAILGFCRLMAFYALDLPADHAQWQMNYIPLWAVDFPISGVYFFLVPAPIAEKYVGPIWWIVLPSLVWWIWLRRREARIATPPPAQ